MPAPHVSAILRIDEREKCMHILILSLMITLAACVLLLIAFGLFTHHIDR